VKHSVILRREFTQESVSERNFFVNRSPFAEVIIKSQVYCFLRHSVDTAWRCCLYKEQEEQRRELMNDMVTCNKMINELESDLLSRLPSTYRCIIDDDDFIRELFETKV